MIDMPKLFAKVRDRMKAETAIAAPAIEFSKWSGLFQKSATETDDEAGWVELESGYPLSCLHFEHLSVLEPEQEHLIVELLAWTADALTNWDAEDDPNGQKLKVIFAIVILLRTASEQFWQLAILIPTGSVLISRLCQYLRNANVVVGVSPRQSQADKEFLRRFQSADKQGSWEALAQDVPQILDHVQCSWPGAIAQFLCLAARDELLKVLGQVNSVITAHAILNRLSLTQASSLAFECGNNHVRFSTLFSLSRGLSEPSDEITKTMQSHLAKIWFSLAADLTTWPNWMAAFNTYPNRFPLLQRSLGQALAKMPPDAMAAYINAISLEGGLQCREVTARCFAAVHSVATKKQRLQLWKLAFDRWSNWNFGDESVLLGIKSSALDYAVIGYVIEGMTAKQRSAELSCLATQAIAVESAWHRDISQYHIAQNRLLSRFHFIATGDCKHTKDQDWLDNKIRLPQALMSCDFHVNRTAMVDITLV